MPIMRPESKRRAARAIVLCEYARSVEEVSSFLGIPVRTIKEWRDHAAGDPEVQALAELYDRELRSTWTAQASYSLRRGIQKLEELIESADPDPKGEAIPRVAAAVKILGELLIVSEATTGGGIPINAGATPIPPYGRPRAVLGSGED